MGVTLLATVSGGYGRAIVVDRLSSLELRPSRPSIYDRDIHLQLLYENPETGVEHYLIRYPVGLRTQLHRHTAAHTMVVLEGRLEVNGQVIGPGAYAHFPAGEVMRHAPVEGESCLLIVIIDGQMETQSLEE